MAASFEVGGHPYDGFWFSSNNTIVIAAGALLSGDLVRHEMLHALVGAAHERQYFVQLCDGVVSCIDECASEAGAPDAPDPAAPEIPASDLVLDVHVDPDSPSIASDSGWIAVSVTLHNTRPSGGWVPLTPVAAGSPFAATFGYIVECVSRCTGGGASAYQFVRAGRFGISANGWRRGVFDHRLPAGVYSVRGTFNSDTTAATLVSVVP